MLSSDEVVETRFDDCQPSMNLADKIEQAGVIGGDALASVGHGFVGALGRPRGQVREQASDGRADEADHAEPEQLGVGRPVDRHRQDVQGSLLASFRLRVRLRFQWGRGVLGADDRLGGVASFGPRFGVAAFGFDRIGDVGLGGDVGAHILRNRVVNGGVERIEARLDEISLAPEFMQQMHDAGVLAVRASLADGDTGAGVAVDRMGVVAVTPSLDEARATLARYVRP